MKANASFPIIVLLPFFLLMAPNQVRSQNKVDVTFGKIKTAIKTNLTCAERYPTMFLNKREAILDFNNDQIPLRKVAVVFFENSDVPKCGTSWVKFDCLDGNCITSSDGNKSAIGIPLKSKTKCYELINLFADLQDALK